MTDLPKFVLDRSFDAPVAMVWRAWTDPALFTRWYGPGAKTSVHAYDLRPGGLWLGEMKKGDWAQRERVEFVEVDPPNRLVWRQSTADADWNIIPSPMMPNWPMVLLTTITFKPAGDHTDLRLVWEPYQATPAERDSFAAALAGLGRGWGAGMDILAALLVELQA